MDTPGFKRKLSAVFMADVVGYSRLMGEDDSATLATLNAYHAVMADLINQHRGRIVDSPGDAVLAEFNSLLAAINPGEGIKMGASHRLTPAEVEKRGLKRKIFILKDREGRASFPVNADHAFDPCVRMSK